MNRRQLWRQRAGRLKNDGGRQALFFLFILIFIVVFPLVTSPDSHRPHTDPISRLYSDVRAHKVTRVQISNPDNDATITLKHGGTYLVAYPTGYGPDLVNYLSNTSVPVSVQGEGFFARFQWFIGAMIFLLGALGYILIFQRGSIKLPGGKATTITPVAPPKERFTDVGGADEVIAEIRQIVDALKNPEKYRGFGVRPLTGMVLYGPPGTGKTLLARATAGEAGVAFFSLKGSDFLGRYLNDGPRLVRSIFDQARKLGVAIIFIDELDSIASRRSEEGDSGTRELNNTLNELLAQIDGFATETSVTLFVLGATNRHGILDPGITRPGRLTRQADMPTPDRIARQKILELHGSRLERVADDVRYDRLAQLTAGMTGAQLADLVNQAGLLALAESDESDEPVATMSHFMAALEVAEVGVARKSREVAAKDREIAAIHEVGHALVALKIPLAPNPRRISVIPRPGMGGHTAVESDDDQFLSVGQLHARMAYVMGGRAAEKLLLDGNFTTGAEHDLERATEIATYMVCKAGMGSRYTAQVASESSGHDPRVADVTNEVDEMVKAAEAKAMEVLEEHRDTLERLRDELLSAETMDEDALAAFLQPVG